MTTRLSPNRSAASFAQVKDRGGTSLAQMRPAQVNQALARAMGQTGRQLFNHPIPKSPAARDVLGRRNLLSGPGARIERP
jgi:hypothetical protein